jgi:cytosine/adenosine deaminase-related metal-dependent hydrolase
MHADYIITADYILPMDASTSVIEKGAIAVQGTDILDVGTAEDIFARYSSEKVIPKKNNVLFPGLINISGG